MYYTHDEKWEREEKKREARQKEQIRILEERYAEILAGGEIPQKCIRYGFAFNKRWYETRTCRDCPYNWIPWDMDGGCMLYQAYRVMTEQNEQHESEVKHDGTNN